MCKYKDKICGLESCPYSLPEDCPDYHSFKSNEEFWTGWTLERDVSEVLK